MKITLLLIGKTDDTNIKLAIEGYEKRLKHYISFEMQVIPDVKNAGKMNALELKEREGDLILKAIKPSDYFVLLDDKGKQMSSVEYSNYLQKCLNAGMRHLVIVVGGAFGFSNKVYERADMQLSLSRMTFTHQMVRLFFVEQTYRAFTILKGESYHHE